MDNYPIYELMGKGEILKFKISQFKYTLYSGSFTEIIQLTYSFWFVELFCFTAFLLKYLRTEYMRKEMPETMSSIKLSLKPSFMTEYIHNARLNMDITIHTYSIIFWKPDTFLVGFSDEFNAVNLYCSVSW